MPVSTNDNPNEAKPNEAKPNEAKPVASSESGSGSTKGEQLSVNDSRLNNQVNCYGVGPDGKKSIQQEVEEKRAEQVAKIDEKDADVLAAAAASGDADVHNLLGQRAVAALNGDEDELKRIDKDIASRQKKTRR
jgi:hypothetical protein